MKHNNSKTWIIRQLDSFLGLMDTVSGLGFKDFIKSITI